MPRFTKAQEQGLRFEIWLEHVLKNVSGIYHVMRNIEYHKEPYVFRQADLSYNIITPQGLELVIVEAKYSSNGPIQYQLREPKQKIKQQLPHINNLVEEIKERETFIGAQKSVLVTNKTFSKDLLHAGIANGIYLIDGKGLATLLARQQKQYTSIDSQINDIRVHSQNNTKNIIYVP
jgi:hypothetical protein